MSRGLSDLNAHLRAWVWEVANQRMHGTTHEAVAARWNVNQLNLQPRGMDSRAIHTSMKSCAKGARCLRILIGCNFGTPITVTFLPDTRLSHGMLGWQGSRYSVGVCGPIGVGARVPWLR